MLRSRLGGETALRRGGGRIGMRWQVWLIPVLVRSTERCGALYLCRWRRAEDPGAGRVQCRRRLLLWASLEPIAPASKGMSSRRSRPRT
eukprot:6196778-Pleurochrysis_carterae.AAC.2